MCAKIRSMRELTEYVLYTHMLYAALTTRDEGGDLVEQVLDCSPVWLPSLKSMMTFGSMHNAFVCR